MPSLQISDYIMDSENLLKKKSKSKSKSDLSPAEAIEKKMKKSKEKESKKRKAVEVTDSDISSELEETKKVAVVSAKKKAKKEEKSLDDEEGEVIAEDEELEEEEEVEENPNAVVNFKISAALREKLKSKGIESLFPIQVMAFDVVLNGKDLVGRAKTGQGKTLAFVLPILESLSNGLNKETRQTGYGRPPSVLVLAPTRELAKQVHADFQFYGGAMNLSTCCLYGGAPYGPQESALRRGVDVVVGTPGRIKDHIEKQNIDLSSLKFRVLDEADEMLNMGFVEDVELILGKVQDVTKVQTLLFSATMPEWVKKISSKFLKPDKKIADLVGDDKMKASTSVRHIALPCFRSALVKIIPDIISCYSSGGRTIVFTETKNAASELAEALPTARALHGDIQQSQREVTLSGFRSGKFSVLVATDVAARGLDINDVQLVVQCEPPRDVETYIHRSGRTGRAGNTGIAVMLYDRKKSYMVNQIERQAGLKFEHVTAPQPADIAKASGSAAVDSITSISDSVVPIFRSSAEQLLKSSGLTPVDLIAKALAKIAGYTEIKSRSLLTCQDEYVTLLLQVGKTMYTPTFAFNVLKRFLPEEKITAFRGLTLTEDGMGAVFDVPKEDLDLVLKGQNNADMVSVEVLKTLPPLQERPQDRQSGGDNWRRGRGGGGFSSRGGGRGGGGRRGGRGGGGGFSRGSQNGGRGGFNSWRGR